MILCRLRNCPRVDSRGNRIPFLSKQGLGSHRRRSHGIEAIASDVKRPRGGHIWCNVPGCKETEPYKTMGGLGSHKRKAHGIVSRNPDSAKRKQSRDMAAGRTLRIKRIAATAAPPQSPGTTTFTPNHLTRTLPKDVKRYLRLRLLYAINGPWAKEWNVSPAVLREAILDLCLTNFAPDKDERIRVPIENAYSRSS